MPQLMGVFPLRIPEPTFSGVQGSLRIWNWNQAMKPSMFSLGGMGQEAFTCVLWHKSQVNMSIMEFQSTAWGLLEPDDNPKRPKAFLYFFLSSSASTEFRT